PAPAPRPRPPSPAVAAPARSTPPTPAPLAAIATPAAPAGAAARPARFAIEFGPFVSPADAERVERRLTEAGYSTIRSRRFSGGTAYAVLIDRVPTTHEAKTIAAALREQGVGDAVI